MTFDEIVTEITSHLGLTSSAATTRIGREVNRFYKRVTVAAGIDAIVRENLTVSANTVIGSQEVTFTSCEKVQRVWYTTSTAKQFLDEVLLSELRDDPAPITGDAPLLFAQKALGNNSVTVYIDQIPESIYALKADVVATVATLSGSTAPAFPESFHYILVEGPLYVEYKKLGAGHVDLAKESLDEYERGLSDLKMWAAKSAYLVIRQNNVPNYRRRTLRRI